MTKLITKLHEMCEIVRKTLIAAEEKSKEYYDRKINPQNFQIGECIFIGRRRVKEIQKSILRAV